MRKMTANNRALDRRRKHKRNIAQMKGENGKKQQSRDARTGAAKGVSTPQQGAAERRSLIDAATDLGHGTDLAAKQHVLSEELPFWSVDQLASGPDV